MTDVNVLDCGKLTAASLAAAAAQMQLQKGKFPAQFSVNSSFVYGILKSSCLGGLCAVMRTESGEDTDPINAHWNDSSRREFLDQCWKRNPVRRKEQQQQQQQEEEETAKIFRKRPLYCSMVDVNSLYPSSW